MSAARDILEKVASGEMTVEEAELQLKMKPFVDLGFAKPDLHRGLRQGVPEVIFGEGKTPEQIDAITVSLMEGGQKTVIITRLSAEKAAALKTSIKYYDVARIGVAGEIPEASAKGTIVVATAGTSDLPVAEEAAVTAELLGNKPHIRRRRIRTSPPSLTQGRTNECERHYRCRRYGRCSCERYRRTCGMSCHCGSDKRRIRCIF